MKKKFIDPELVVDHFEEDIICYSGGGLTDDNGEDDSGTITGNKGPDT